MFCHLRFPTVISNFSSRDTTLKNVNECGIHHLLLSPKSPFYVSSPTIRCPWSAWGKLLWDSENTGRTVGFSKSWRNWEHSRLRKVQTSRPCTLLPKTPLWEVTSPCWREEHPASNNELTGLPSPPHLFITLGQTQSLKRIFPWLSPLCSQTHRFTCVSQSSFPHECSCVLLILY